MEWIITIWVLVAIILIAISNVFIDKNKKKGLDTGGAPFVQFTLIFWPLYFVVAPLFLATIGLTWLVKKQTKDSGA
jgi:hypothetical protein